MPLYCAPRWTSRSGSRPVRRRCATAAAPSRSRTRSSTPDSEAEQALALEARQLRRIHGEHEELVRIVDAGRMVGIDDRAEEIVVVGDPQRVTACAGDDHIGAK